MYFLYQLETSSLSGNFPLSESALLKSQLMQILQNTKPQCCTVHLFQIKKDWNALTQWRPPPQRSWGALWSMVFPSLPKSTLAVTGLAASPQASSQLVADHSLHSFTQATHQCYQNRDEECLPPSRKLPPVHMLLHKSSNSCNDSLDNHSIPPSPTAALQALKDLVSP